MLTYGHIDSRLSIQSDMFFCLKIKQELETET